MSFFFVFSNRILLVIIERIQRMDNNGLFQINCQIIICINIQKVCLLLIIRFFNSQQIYFQLISDKGGGVRAPDNAFAQKPEQSLLSHYQTIQQQQQQMNAFNPNPGSSWNNGAMQTNGIDSNSIVNWPQQMAQFPMKPLDSFQANKQPSYTQYQSDSIAANQLQSPNQQYNLPIVNPMLPNIPLTNVQQLNHNNEEVLPEKNTFIKDVPVLDRKKDGKNVFAHESESLSTDDSEYKYDEDEQPTTELPKKKKKHRKVNKVSKTKTGGDSELSIEDPAVQQIKLLHSSLHVEYMDHDGESDHPSGAVVSLAMGIFFNFFFRNHVSITQINK